MNQAQLDVRHSFRFSAFVLLTITFVVTFARAFAAVTIQSFTAQGQTATIIVKWTTATELNNAGFNLYRGNLPTGSFNKITSGLIPANNPGSILGSSYSFTDSGVSTGQTYYYKLESVDFSGSTQQFGPVSAAIAAPTATPTTPSATPTATTIVPSATKTPTIPTTATNTSVPRTATSTVYSSPTPLGTLPPTSTPFPTRIAYVGGIPTRTPLPANGRVNVPPTPNASSAPPTSSESPAPQNDQPMIVAVNPGSSNSPDETDTASDVPATRALPNPLYLATLAVASLFAVSALAVGAAAFYFFARRFID